MGLNSYVFGSDSQSDSSQGSELLEKIEAKRIFFAQLLAYGKQQKIYPADASDLTRFQLSRFEKSNRNNNFQAHLGRALINMFESFLVSQNDLFNSSEKKTSFLTRNNLSANMDKELFFSSYREFLSSLTRLLGELKIARDFEELTSECSNRTDFGREKVGNCASVYREQYKDYRKRFPQQTVYSLRRYINACFMGQIAAKDLNLSQDCISQVGLMQENLGFFSACKRNLKNNFSKSSDSKTECGIPSRFIFSR